MADDNTIGDYFKAAAVLAVAVAASSAINQALAGKQKNAVQSYPLNQSIMPVTNFVGDYSKTAGGYVFRQKVNNNFATIQAISEGRLDSFNGFYLADDKVTINGSGTVIGVTNGGTTITDGRYQDNNGKIRVKIQTRLGAPTETAYSDITTSFPSIWDSSCRGDNTGSICVQRFSADAKFQGQIFPGGAPEVSVVARGVCYDWRKDSTAGGSGTQRRNTPSTWAWSANPIVWLVHKEWTAWGRDWDTQIAPLLADLTTEADYCDTAFPKKAGGTEPIYAVAFNYPDDEDFTVTRQRILDSMDGFYCEDGYGRLVLKAGRYEEPDLTFTGDDIFASHWEGGELSSDAVDQINISFVSPENDYKQVNCDPWVINDGGLLSTPLDLEGVNQLPQARYLGKRKAARLMPNYRGWIRVGRKGRQALTRRYIRVQNPRRVSMNDVVCEITGIEYDPAAREFTINLISADPNIDTWNPATEEGDPVDAVPGVDPGALDTPTIQSVTPFYDGSNVRLKVITTGPDRDDLTWSARWRVTGSTSWNEGTYPDAVPVSGGQVYLNTGVVIVAPSLDVQTFYFTAGGSPSPYSATFTVNSSVVPPSWVDPGALWQADLTAASNRFWDGNVEYASLSAAITAGKATYSRASQVWVRNAAAAYTSIASGVVAMTDYGALIEPSATNNALYSDTMSNAAWVVSGGTKTAGQTTPIGSDGALYTGNGASAAHYIGQAGLSFTSGNSYTITARIKAGTIDRVQLTLNGGSSAQYSNFYLNGAGSVTATGAGSSNSIRLENGWYILTHTAAATTTTAAGAAYTFVLVTGSETRAPTVTSSGTFTLGHMAVGPTEEGSPITTTSAPVTRAATALLFKPVPGTYDITLTMGDGTTSTLSAVTITGSGWTVPTALNRYVKKIVATA